MSKFPSRKVNQLPKPSRKMKRRHFLTGAAASLSTVGLGSLSGCGWTLANVRPPATYGNSNELLIYTWSSYTDEKLLALFEQETGFRVVVDIFDANETMLSKFQAGGGGGYSIIYPSDYMVKKMMELNLLRELDKSLILGLEQLFPRFQNPKYDRNNSHSIPVAWGTTGLIYNTKKITQPVKDWKFLWDNQQSLKKRITLINDVREVMGATLKKLGFSYNATNPQQIKQAYEELVKLKPAIASFTSDAWKPQLLAGDLSISMCYSSDAKQIITENKAMSYVVPSSGSSSYVDTLVIPKTAPNPQAAYAWINFLLQPRIAAYVMETLEFATPNQAAFTKLPLEKQKDETLFPAPATLEKLEGIEPVGNATSIFEEYWTKLTSG